ncbi:MAG: hypothetical protein DSZ03_04310 [Sulfurimonas sp.]|nr:MAG: hypothetical protein DSZ03_04310 [Sulfurimonas sp.]
MKHLKVGTLLLAAALFTGMGATTLSAEGMKCGAGKCGNAKEAVNAAKSAYADANGSKKVEEATSDAKAAMKCGTGKCGTGKCGNK